MKYLLFLTLLLLFGAPAFAQPDKEALQFLDSLGIKYDANDPDGEMKVEKELQKIFLEQYDSAMTVASNSVIDPFNTEKLSEEILNDFNEGDDTTNVDFDFFQEAPIIQVDLANPDPRFYTSEGFVLPNNLSILIVQGNGSGLTVDMGSLISKLNNETISQLYLAYDKEGISEIPDEIGNLKSLKILALYGNNISSLPTSIGELSQLEELYIDANPIETLPEVVGEMKSLKILGIAQTKISPSDIARLKQQLPNCKILLQ